MDLRKIAVHETDLLQLAQAAGDPRQQRATSNGGDDVAREAPAKLLGDLESHRLRAFRVVCAQVDVREAPPQAVRDLRAQAIHVVVIAAHADDVRMEDCRAEDLSDLEVVGNEYEALEAEARRVR